MTFQIKSLHKMKTFCQTRDILKSNTNNSFFRHLKNAWRLIHLTVKQTLKSRLSVLTLLTVISNWNSYTHTQQTWKQSNSESESHPLKIACRLRTPTQFIVQEQINFLVLDSWWQMYFCNIYQLSFEELDKFASFCFHISSCLVLSSHNIQWSYSPPELWLFKKKKKYFYFFFVWIKTFWDRDCNWKTMEMFSNLKNWEKQNSRLKLNMWIFLYWNMTL